MKVSRRDFLKTSAAGAAAATVSGGIFAEAIGSPAARQASALNKWPGRVVINFNKNALSGTADEQAATLKNMVDQSILRLTDQTDLGAAWKAVFPSTGTNALTATSKIAIKVPLGYALTPCGPHWRHVKAMVDGLRLMDFDGTKFSGTITIYDNFGSNNLNGFGFNTTNFPGCSVLQDGLQTYGDGVQGNRAYSRSLNAANFLINVFTPRGHSGYDGFTLCFKNHFGTYNPTAHDLNLTTINTTGPVFDKTVLCMCSAIYGSTEGQAPAQGPKNYSTYAKKIDPTAAGTNANTLFLTTDAISAEQQAIKIMRMNDPTKGGFTTNDMPSYLKNAQSFGTINPTDIRTIINSTTEVNVPEAGLGRNIHAHVTATHIKGHNGTFIQYALPSEFMGKDIALEIYDTKGSLVRRLSDKPMGTLSHFSWDERDAANRFMRSGNYIVRLIAGSTQMSTQLAIMR